MEVKKKNIKKEETEKTTQREWYLGWALEE